jgi:DNA-binding GntR family transcriptional regulator
MTQTPPAPQDPAADAAAAPVDSAGLAYTRIRNQILSGQLRPGTVVSQVRLARELRISRTPLREALRQLGAEGLVIGDFNRRLRISELDLDDFDEIYAMRLALEPLGVNATIPRLTAGQKESLAHHVQVMGQAIADRDLELFREHHKGFHLGLVLRCGPRLTRTITELWDHSERYRIAYLLDQAKVLEPGRQELLSDERFRLSQTEHEQILEAALAGEAALCSHRLVAHLQRTVDGVYQQAPHNRIPAMSRHVAHAFHGQDNPTRA